MLVYSSDKIRFLDDVRGNVISDRIIEALLRSGHGNVSDSERRSFEQSLQYMKNVLEIDTIPDDAGVALEYKIPQTSKRVDMIVSGLDESRRETCVIVELKQWERAEVTAKDAIVRTFLGGAHRETTHPSYQAWSYASLLKDFNQTVQEDEIRLEPCAYLHNCVDESGILDDHYQAYIDRAPVFLRKDMARLQQFIQRYVRHGDKNRVLYRVEKGRIRPSRDLATSLARLIKGKSDFLMIDDQKLVYEAALEVSGFSQQGEKQVLIVEGGPGTGKSIVAINLLVELTNRYKTVNYVTPNRAPRQVYEGRLTGTLTKSRFSNMFKGAGSYDGSEDGELDVLVVDEAHRLVERSQYQKSGANQTRDIIRAAKTAVFFIDEDQQVTWKDAGSRAEIEHWAKELGATTHHAVLQSQFRCNGSDGYLSWLDRILGVHDTAQDDLAGIDYDLAVVGSPSELRDRITMLHRSGYKARLVAGYCWDWNSKKDPDAWDITFPEDDFAMQWNLSNDEGRYLEKAHSIDQIGCIHTVQGLEMDYVGVIIGPDLVVRNGCVVTQPEMRARTDKSLHGYKKHRKEAPESADARADAIIKNTYRALLSRGLKGCFIHCTDEETQEYFQQQVAIALNEVSNEVQDAGSSQSVVGDPGEELDSDEENSVPQIVLAENVSEADNAVPLLDLEAAAGGFAVGFAEEQMLEDVEKWVALPDFYHSRPGLFAVRVVGDSMNRRIPNGSLCLFEAKPGGSRNGQVVLAYHRDIQDPDNNGGLTVKVYRSEKIADSEDEWKHSRIVLACDTLEVGYEDMVLDDAQAGELQVLGVFKGIVA